MKFSNLLAAKLALVISLCPVYAGEGFQLRWDFDFHYRDVLEWRYPPESAPGGADILPEEGRWTAIPGPYPLSPTRTEYRVNIPTDGEGKLFRIRRIPGVSLACFENCP
jgi:hypothetical protein